AIIIAQNTYLIKGQAVTIAFPSVRIGGYFCRLSPRHAYGKSRGPAISVTLYPGRACPHQYARPALPPAPSRPASRGRPPGHTCQQSVQTAHRQGQDEQGRGEDPGAEGADSHSHGGGQRGTADR